MQTFSRSSFTTVTTEGAVLPADLLQRITDGRDIEGLRPEDYHLAPNERLNEAINRSWNRLIGVWENFEDQRRDLPESDRGTTLTRERWLLILLQELGYGRLPFQGSSPVDSEDAESDHYPISHEYDQVPLHLITFRQPLDRADLTQGERFRRSPHSLLQEFLNRSEDHLWGIVSNGLRLRILRDNVSFTRAAYLEFDLEAMMNGEIYADFTLLWLVAHQSRVEGPPESCWLEKWSQEAADLGTRALDSLRDGVQEAISMLGRGFLAHPANGDLRGALRGGDLSTDDYYRQLLRLVYRLIFLFVAEDRDLLLMPETDPATRQRYLDYYSLSRLRELAARRRSGPHPDLYRSLRLVMELLREGYPELGLPALGSFLFSDRSTPDLDDLEIANEELLDAIRELAFTVENRVLRPVDYKNLGAEELGSVYESLLELHPELNVAAATFELRTAAGSERKTTGSYYTPSSLINSLLDSALEPVVADRLRGKRGLEAEEALRDIKVVDPAAGSGHFLIAVANRLARHLARIRTGDEEPSPEANRIALRDVVRRCIYGVDINEMAVELCKVALWMETLDPGKPLNFLDANIQCGNSLIGATPALLDRGIPDDAFKPITGDDKAYCSEWKKRNKAQRSGQMDLLVAGTQPWERLGNLAEALSELEELEDGTLAGVQRQEDAYADLVRSTEYEYGKLWADSWCAAFVWHKKPGDQGGLPYPITEQVFRRLERSPYNEPKWLKDEIKRLADEFRFFHWHLAFPQVFRPAEHVDLDEVTGWDGGFDVVLGNPPWDKMQTEELQFFGVHDPDIAELSGAARKKAIKELSTTNPHLEILWRNQKRLDASANNFARGAGRFPLTGVGKFNMFALFSELSRHITNGTGRTGIIVLTGIASDYTTRYFFQDIIQKSVLVSLFDFENRNGIFPGVHRSYKFCLLTLSGKDRLVKDGALFVFFALDIADLRDSSRRFQLSSDDILRLNPNTRTCPIFRYQRDAEITTEIYHRVPIFHLENNPECDPYQPTVWRLINTSDDSEHFVDPFTASVTADLLPVVEAKTIHQFDHRYATYQKVSGTLDTLIVTESSKDDPTNESSHRFYITEQYFCERMPEELLGKRWFLTARNIARSTDERTLIASVFPRAAGCEHTPYIEIRQDARAAAFLLGVFNSFVLDYVARQKVGGTHISYFILYQLPVLPYKHYHEFEPDFFRKRLNELIFTSYSMKGFAHECGFYGPPFRWDEERRFHIRCELDAALFHLYGIERDDVDYIMDTFPIVRRKDEAAHGEYRTKRVILEIYDEMAKAMRADQPYQTRLDPPPAHPDAAHPWDEEYLGPYKQPDEWWQEVEDSVDLDVPDSPPSTETPAETPTAFATKPSATTIKEPDAVLELRSPEPARPKKKPKPSAPSDQPALISDFSPPTGGRSQRLKRVMSLGQPKNSRELQELVAALGDEDSNIRWLAASSLVRLRGHAVVNMLAAYLETNPGSPAQEEAQKVLGLIADADEDETVRKAARIVLE